MKRDVSEILARIKRKLYQIGKGVSLIGFLVLSWTSSSFAILFPQDYQYSLYSEILVDEGLLPQSNSSFHPFQEFSEILPDRISLMTGSAWIYKRLSDYSQRSKPDQNLVENPLKINFHPAVGLSWQGGADREYNKLAVRLSLFSSFVYQHNYYAQFHVRVTNEPKSLAHYTGVRRDITRLGINTAEVDKSVIGFRNSWCWLEFGRSREIWGPEVTENILLSGDSPPYERLMAQFTYKSFSFRWFYGFLETVDNSGEDLNRYLTGRIIEYNNKRNFILSLGEVSVLSGLNRPVDWSFLNPIGLHLEVEQNRRENVQTDNQSNNMLFLNVDWFALSRLRLSGTLMLDEFQLDQEDREQNEANALGSCCRLSYHLFRVPVSVFLTGKYLRIDTFSYQHSYGYSNLVTHGEMIGHRSGNDADYWSLGLRSIFPQNIIASAGYHVKRWGSNSLLENPYRAYIYDEFKHKQFPSGEVRENHSFDLQINYSPLMFCRINLDGHFNLLQRGPESGSNRVTFSLEFILP